MLSDEAISRLSKQIATVKSPAVREAYLRFALDLNGVRGLQLWPDSHGYIESELRFYLSDDWYFSAVLNAGWVLFYFRNPALRDGYVDRESVLRKFPDAEPTNARDIKLRVLDLSAASAVCSHISQSELHN